MIKTKEVSTVDAINGYLEKGWTLIRVKEIGRNSTGKIEILLTKDDEEQKTE